MRVSPTRFPLFTTCTRRWWLTEVARLPQYEEEPEHFRFGTAAHRVAEQLLEGEEPEQGGWEYEVGAAFAHLSREFCDVQGTEIDVWVTGADVSCTGGGYVGRLDAWGWVERGGETMPALIDHKTSANPKLAAERGASPWQVHLYAYPLMAEFGVDRVLAHWHWLPSRRRADPLDGAEVWERIITRAEALPWVERACRISLEMHALIAAGVPPAPYYVTENDPFERRCMAHYGCPWIGQCEGVG